MKKGREYSVYIIASYSGTLYTGVTNDLFRRIVEHKNSLVDGFSKKYACTRLVYFEKFDYINDAIKREKQIKSWSRKKKMFLIKQLNPHWNDLFKDIK